MASSHNVETSSPSGLSSARRKSNTNNNETKITARKLQVQGHNKAEQEILQAAVDGASVDYFRNLSSSKKLVRCQNDECKRNNAEENNEPNGDHSTPWWLHIFDKAHGCSVLHWAAGMGHLHLVQWFLTEYDGDDHDHDHDDAGGDLVNQPAQGNSQGRTPLHYACRNGHLAIARCLVEQHGAHVNPVEVRHGVTPFHLAVWRNQLPVCQWLVHECGVDAGQANVFGCTAIHWLGLIPHSCLPPNSHNRNDIINNKNGEKNDGPGILELATWLCQLPQVDVYAKQKQGHSVLHKAAWGGHLELCRFFHNVYGMYDDTPDDAGNYAADLADMAGHDTIAVYLRQHGSADTLQSCQILGLSEKQRYDKQAIKLAYHAAARKLHPDRAVQSIEHNNDNVQAFITLSQAYRHLMDQDGVGSQHNPKHDLPLLLTYTTNQVSFGSSKQQLDDDDDSSAAITTTAVESRREFTTDVTATAAEEDRFASQLTSVVLEYGNKGLDISNLRKKWRQLWPETDFPASKKGSLKQWLQKHAHHVVSVRVDEKSNTTRVYALFTHSQR